MLEAETFVPAKLLCLCKVLLACSLEDCLLLPTC